MYPSGGFTHESTCQSIGYKVRSPKNWYRSKWLINHTNWYLHFRYGKRSSCIILIHNHYIVWPWCHPVQNRNYAGSFFKVHFYIYFHRSYSGLEHPIWGDRGIECLSSNPELGFIPVSCASTEKPIGWKAKNVEMFHKIWFEERGKV